MEYKDSNTRKWKREDFKKYVESVSDCTFIDTYIKEKTNPNGNNRRWLKLKCKCGNEFETTWARFNRNDQIPKRHCNECGKMIGHKKKTINDKHYEELKKEKQITIKHLEPYKGRTVQIKHECPICKRQDWIVTPASILNGYSTCCKKCSSKKRTLTNKDYIKRKQKLGIKIKNIEPYKGLDINIDHICPECGEVWKVAPHRILSKNSQRCLKCSYKYRAKNQKNTQEQVKGYIESKGCKWIDGKYSGKDSILTYECSCGNLFSRRFSDFKNKEMFRCEKCTSTLSLGELKIKEYLEKNNIKYNQQQKFKDLRGKKKMPLSYDFSILDDKNNITSLIEFDGIYHFKQGYSTNKEEADKRFKEQKQRDEIKDLYAKENNIPLLRIKFIDYKNIDTILDSYFK